MFILGFKEQNCQDSFLLHLFTLKMNINDKIKAMKYIDFGNKIIFVFDLSYENELIGNKEYN